MPTIPTPANPTTNGTIIGKQQTRQAAADANASLSIFFTEIRGNIWFLLKATKTVYFLK
jgi:hypothetical protein